MEKIENTAFLATYSLTDIVKEVTKQSNQQLSLIADDLIEKANKETATKGEFLAYMKGAAFIFYRLAAREQSHSAYGNTVNTPEDAVKHCMDLLPFMKFEEKIEHLKLIQWLNEYIELKGGKKIEMPTEFQLDADIREAQERQKQSII